MSTNKNNFVLNFLSGFVVTAIFILLLKTCGQVRIKVEVTDEPVKEAK